jgi:NADP-dependent 3-hydroxy acid dehydrogenase YdfG
MEFVSLAADTYGRLDVLVSNAGIMPVSPFDALRVDDWEAMVDVNLKGVLFGIAAALPVFRRQRSGHFVNLASTAAFRSPPLSRCIRAPRWRSGQTWSSAATSSRCRP